MRTYGVSHTTARSVVRHSATILFCALAMLGLLSCSEPVAVDLDADRASPRLVAQFSHAGEPDYTVASIPIDQDPTPAGTHPFLRDDDFTTGLIPIGFEFEFFGTKYTQINIATNGFVGFDADMGQGCCAGYSIPDPDLANPSVVNNVIAAVWSDLVPDASGQIFYGVTGAAPHRRFIVHYRNVAFWGGRVPGPRVNVQIKLFETTNVIEIHSLIVPANSHQSTQGVENASGDDAYYVPGRVAANFELANDAVRFTPPGDNTPPSVTAHVSGTVGTNDWYTSDVAVTWTVIDSESAISVADGCADVGIASDQHPVTYTCTATSGGGSTSEAVTIKRDATAPSVTYSGSGAYTVDQFVTLACAATDATSGVAASTCSSVSGDAYTFALGANSVSASATDRAGNTGSASASFTVSVTEASLCNLVKRWVDQSGVANSLCQRLAAGAYDAFRNQVRAQSGKRIPADKASQLIRLSNAL